jgi:hypothetical protein
MALAILCLAGFVLDSWTAQPASRYLLTVAVVDHHTLTLDQDADRLEDDQALYRGHHYSDKAPYQPLLATPVYAAFRALGGDAFTWEPGEDHRASGFHWGRWLTTVWSATVPAIVLCLLLRRLVAQDSPEWATPAALALSLGTMLLPFAGALFGHVLAAALLTGAWILVRGRTVLPRAVIVSGLLLGLAVGTEFAAAIPAAVIAVVVIQAHGWTAARRLAGGGLVAILPLLAYNWVAFGSPLRTAYQGNLPNFQGSGSFGISILVVPQLDELGKAMLGDRGLLVLTPICTLALVGAVQAIIRRTPARRDALMGLVILGTMWVLSAGIDGYGGASPGPRYLVPALPFLAVPLAEAWRRHPRLCAGAAIIGFVPMMAATLTAPLVATNYTRSARYWLDRLVHGDVTRSVPGELLGTWALYALVAVGIACAVAAVDLDRRRLRLRPTSSTGGSRSPGSGHLVDDPQHAAGPEHDDQAGGW